MNILASILAPIIAAVFIGFAAWLVRQAKKDERNLVEKELNEEFNARLLDALKKARERDAKIQARIKEVDTGVDDARANDIMREQPKKPEAPRKISSPKPATKRRR